MWGGFFYCAREYVFVLKENEVKCQLVSEDRTLCVIELGLCCQWLKAPVFQAESPPRLRAQGFPPSFSGFLIPLQTQRCCNLLVRLFNPMT